MGRSPCPDRVLLCRAIHCRRELAQRRSDGGNPGANPERLRHDGAVGGDRRTAPSSGDRSGRFQTVLHRRDYYRLRPSADRSDPGRDSDGGARISLKRLYQQSPFGLVAASLCGVTTSAFFALGPILAQRLGLDTRGVAVLMASGTLGGFLLAWPIGWLSDRFDRRFVIIATALTATAALVTIIALVPDEPSRWILYLCAAILGGTIVPTYSVVMAYVNDAVGEGEFVAASGGPLIVQGVGATAGPLIGGVAMSAWDHGLAYTLIAAQILLAVFGVYRSTRRAAPHQMDKGRFVVEPFIQVGT